MPWQNVIYLSIHPSKFRSISTTTLSFTPPCLPVPLGKQQKKTCAVQLLLLLPYSNSIPSSQKDSRIFTHISPRAWNPGLGVGKAAWIETLSRNTGIGGGTKKQTLLEHKMLLMFKSLRFCCQGRCRIVFCNLPDCAFLRLLQSFPSHGSFVPRAGDSKELVNYDV